ncbi:hypothetical protein LRS71_08080 [Rhodococcus pyridinivorans]|uniref:hypothetical protein n=1 Tax=Rhodococcus pyridinivorans TaxID=103816 RepID=UPI001E3CFFAA|nr:hypothetical protein [Rhodococcus pyridinivorans]MCD5419519.1 hypothetical protein [Rhodococcus pyridinivorans]
MVHYNAQIDQSVERGEDWSEILSTQVAHLLGIPVAETRMVRRHGRRGTISKDIRPDGFDLHMGLVILDTIEGYFPHVEGAPGVDPARPGVKRPGHNLLNIRLALEGYDPPPGSEYPELTSFDVFAGYCLFDALVGNRDRHEENWAVLIPQLIDRSPCLAPSYDHASSLGFNLTDKKRTTLLQNLMKFAEGGTAHRFEHVGNKPPTLVSLALQALDLCTPKGKEWWVSRLVDLDLGPVLTVLEQHQVPNMSDIEARFARELLELNLRRIKDGIQCHA